MDVKKRRRSGEWPDRPDSTGVRGSAQVGRLLGQHRRRELALARGFRQCRRLNDAQLEELYADARLALLGGEYENEEHLLNTLRKVLKRRALNFSRDGSRRVEILAENAPGMHALQAARNAEQGPEQQALARADRLLVIEFMAELSKDERRVYGMLAEGIKRDRIATELNVKASEVQKTERSYERKRERFQLLYEAGRLCGYRADTIRALQSGQATSEELALRAIAHVDNCAYCRAQHKTNAKRLRAAFERQAAALLPLPALTIRMGLQHVGLRTRLLFHRLMPWASSSPGGARERAAALLAGGGATAKVATTIVAAAVIAGGTVGVTYQTRPHPHTQARARPNVIFQPTIVTHEQATQVVVTRPTRSVLRPRKASTGHVVPVAHPAASQAQGTHREPGGFAYLGVPRSTQASEQNSTPARATTSSHGGPFSP
jgi:hypothetical protein